MDFTQFTLEEVNALNKNTLMEVLGIECVELGVNSIKFKMPVDARTHQPMGILHGGASAALIETVGSFGSFLMADPKNERPVGLSINAEHIRAVRNGNVIATGTLIHPGGSTHIWQVNINEETTEQLVCTGRLTIMRIKNSMVLYYRIPGQETVTCQGQFHPLQHNDKPNGFIVSTANGEKRYAFKPSASVPFGV